MLHLDTGNTAFTLLCASLVMLMTPGLAFFYGGLVGRKNVLAIMMQSFVSMGWTTVLVVGLRILALFLRRSEERHGLLWNHRQPELGGPARHHARHAFAERHDPDARLLRLPDDVRHHHAGADHRRIYQPHHLQGLHAVSDGVADPGLLSVRPHDVGRRHPGGMGREGFCRRHRRAQHRGHRRARFHSLRRQAQGRGPRSAQHSARGARHWLALVWLVRLQCRIRVSRRFDHGGRVYQHRHCRVVCGDRVVAGGLASLEEAEIPRLADRRGGGSRHDHARSGLRVAGHCGHHRNWWRASSAITLAR